MTERSYSLAELLIGAAAVVAVVGGLVYGVASAAGGAGARGYTLEATFASAEGIARGSEVRIAGVRVGEVTHLDLNPETLRAETRFTMRRDIALPDDSVAAIASEGVMGGHFLELRPGSSPFLLAPGDTVTETESAVSLLSLLIRYAAGEGRQ